MLSRSDRTDAVAIEDRREDEGGRGRTSQSPEGWSGFGYRVLRWFLARRLRALGCPPIAVELAGLELYHPACCPIARICARDLPTLVRLALQPSQEFGEGYSDGRLEVAGDLVELLAVAFRRWGRTRQGGGWGFLEWPARSAAALARSRRQASHHYDIGNDFYRLWLDEQLVYTCAYFPRREMTLEEAQVAKLEHVCRKLQLRPGQEVVEAGCGWGALALHMARHHGVTVKAYNVSREQVAYARRRAADEGLDDRVEFIDDDWRSIRGRFDVFASVGMLEHVGRRNYPLLGDVIDRVLKPGGRGLIHCIGRNAPHPIDPWIRQRVFPGAYVPALSEMAPIFEPHDFSILDVENLRLHYAATLRHWLQRFERSADEVAAMFDEAFLRRWRLYLAGSVAAFETGWMQLFQIVFARGDDNSIPWTRVHQYEPALTSGPHPSGTAPHEIV